MKKSLILLLVALACFGVSLGCRNNANASEIIALRRDVGVIQSKRLDIEECIEEMYCDLEEMRIIVQELRDSIKPILEITEIKEVDLSFYAPLDPKAVEGMCFSGNPEITASGKKVVIGDTVAAGPGVPFHTKVFIQSRGLYTVHDRGGAIGDNDIDIAVLTRTEALRRGRATARAVFFYPENLLDVTK